MLRLALLTLLPICLFGPTVRASLSFIEGFSGSEFVYDFDTRLDPGVTFSDTSSTPLTISTNSADLFSDIGGASLGNNITDNQTMFSPSTIIITFDVLVNRAGFSIAGETNRSGWDISYYSGSNLLGSSSLAIVGHGAYFFWEQYSDPITSIDITDDPSYSLGGPTHIDDIHFENVPEPTAVLLCFLLASTLTRRRSPTGHVDYHIPSQFEL